MLADGSVIHVDGEYIRYSEATAHLYEQSEGYVSAIGGNLALAPVYKKGWKTYNFEVEDFHTYIAGGVRVHNQSVYTATGKDLPVGNYLSASGGRLQVNEDGSITNLDTNYTSPSAGEYAHAKYVSADFVGSRISPGEQSDMASNGAFAHWQSAGSGPNVTLASGNVVSAGTVFATGSGYTSVVNADGSVTNQQTGRTSGVGTRQYNADTNTWETVQAPGSKSTPTSSSSSSGNDGGGKSSQSDHGSSSSSTSSGSSSSSSDSSSSGSASGKPVLLDLDREDGIEITPLSSSNTFLDVLNDGLKHRTAWAGAGDGVLVRDSGNDGVINLANEIDFTQWDSTARSDIEALRNVFDTNHDGRLTAADQDWSLFKVLVTNPNGTSTLKILAELYITGLDLITNNQEVVYSDGSKVLGTASYTKTDGSTGLLADATLKFDIDGYLVTETVTIDTANTVDTTDDSTTIVTIARDTDGNLAKKTVLWTSPDGLTRKLTFDDNGDGVNDRVQEHVKVNNLDGSITETMRNFDVSGAVLVSRQEQLTSTDRKTVTVSLDPTGSNTRFDRVEVRHTAPDGSLSVTVRTLNANGSTHDETTTTTSADGLSKTVSIELTGSGVVNGTRTETTSVATDGKRTETVTNYAGDGTTTTHRIGSTVTTSSADGSVRDILRDLDGNGSTDLKTSSVIVRNANGTTTTASDTNNNGMLRSRTVTELTADGHSKTVRVDLDGDLDFDLISEDVKTFGGDGSTTQTITSKSGSGATLSRSVSTWSADGKTRTTTVDSDGDTHTDRTQTVAIVGGNSVETSSVYSPDGTLLMSKSVKTTSADGLTQTTQVDQNGDGTFDATSISTKVLVDGSSTVTEVLKNGAGTLQLGKAVVTTSANGLSVTELRYLNAATSPYQKATSVTVPNADKSTTQTVTTFAGTDLVQTGRSVTDISADRLTTTVKTFVNANTSPESIATTVKAADGTQTTTVSSYSPNGAVLIGRSITVTSADGLTTTTTSDITGDGVTDATRVTVTTYNVDGSVTTTTTDYAGSAAAAGNRTTTTQTMTSGNGLSITTRVDASSDGVFETGSTDVTVLDVNGGRTRTVKDFNGALTSQTGRTVAIVSDDGLVKTNKLYLANHTTPDRVTTATTVLGLDGSSTETIVTRGFNNVTLLAKTVIEKSGSGLSSTISSDLDGNNVNDQVTTATIGANGNITKFTSTFDGAGVLASRSAETVSDGGFKRSTNIDLDGNDTIDRSEVATTAINADGSRTETLTRSGAGGVQQDKTIVVTTADGLSVTTHWEGSTAGTDTRSRTDVTTPNANGSSTRVVSDFNGSGALYQRATVTTTADGLASTTSKDVNGDLTIDQTIASVRNADGSTLVSAMEGAASAASGRAFGTLGGRYESTTANGLTKVTRYDATGDGLAERQTTDTVTIGSAGTRTHTTTHATLSGGSASSANPSYTVTKEEVAVATISRTGLSTTTQWDLTGAGSYTQSKTDVTSLSTSGSVTQTVSYLTGTALTSKYQVITSSSGLTVTKNWDATGSGAYTQILTSVTAATASGAMTETVTNTNDLGNVLSQFLTTTSADGRTETVQRDFTGAGYSESTKTNVVTLADGSTTATESRFNTASVLLDRTITQTSADGRNVTVSLDANGDNVIDQTRVIAQSIDGRVSSTVTDFGAGGVVLTKATTATSLDGLVTTLQRDLNGDGTFDQSTTTTRAQRADGSSSEVVQVFQISQLGANGQLTSIAPVLLSTVSTAVRADGRLKTVTEDVDGDGDVDKTTTTGLKIDGSSVATTINNDIVRAQAASVGEAVWSSAVETIYKTTAAAVIVTLHADGVTKVVQADYDGNGTYEHTETWRTRVDGVTSATISDVNASGTVVASGTQKISADGLTVELNVDRDSNGTIDQRQTATTRIDGSVLRTETNLNTDGSLKQTQTETVSASGRLLNSLTTDGSGRKLVEITTALDGSTTKTTYDVSYGNGTYSSGTQNLGDGDGIWNKGAPLVGDFNGDGLDDLAFAWNNAGLQIRTKLSNGDGTYRVVEQQLGDGDGIWNKGAPLVGDFNGDGLDDLAFAWNNAGLQIRTKLSNNAYLWSRVVQTFDSYDKQVSEVQYNDDATRTHILFDVASGKQTLLHYYNTKDVLVGITEHDFSNANSWSRIERSYDAIGRVTVHNQFNDDGTRWLTTYDVSGTYSWSSFTGIFNASGQKYLEYWHLDNGGRSDLSYDVASGNLAWESHYNASSVLTNSVQHDFNNTQPWFRIERSYNAAGAVISVKQYFDNGTIAPVLLDLDGDGQIDLRPLDQSATGTSGPTFDWDSDGTAEDTAWVGPLDGFLVLDLAADGSSGGDGLIAQAKELAFSLWADPTLEADGDVTDLDGLRLAFDSNHDNVLDNSDAHWDEFRVWQDVNQNGISDAGELRTLSEAGIGSVNLLPSSAGATLFTDGSAITGTSSYQKLDGTRFLVADASLAYRSQQVGEDSTDTPTGGAGNDILSGGGGSDVFVFADISGQDTISDFQVHAGIANSDVIELHGESAADFAALLAGMTESAGITLVHLDSGDSIALSGVSISQLTADDFRFL